MMDGKNMRYLNEDGNLESSMNYVWCMVDINGRVW